MLSNVESNLKVTFTRRTAKSNDNLKLLIFLIKNKYYYFYIFYELYKKYENFMTTITIEDETKEELLKVAAQLQIKRREKINYDTAIKFLLENYQKKKDQEKLRQACQKVEGINVDEILGELYEERRKDEISF
jgi:hypothetical protein